MDLIVFTPTWVHEDGSEAMAEECQAAIEAQDIDCEWEWIVGRDNPYPILSSRGKAEYQNVLHQYRRAQLEFLKSEAGALLFVEHDEVLPDRTAVQRMLETLRAPAELRTSASARARPGPAPAQEIDIVYAPYLFRHSRPYQISTWQWINHRNLGMSLSHYPTELRRARQALIWKISGAGFGCILIRRRVLEAIEFRASSINNHCPDIAFAEDALRAGFISVGRFDVPMWHRAGERWLNPFKEYGKMKYLAVETVNAIAAGRHVRLIQDQQIELTDEEAQDLARVGYILYTAPAPEAPDEIGFPTPTPVQSEVPAAKKSRRRPGAGP